MHRTIARTGLGLLTALALAVAGCAAGQSAGGDDATAASGADPRLALAASTDSLAQESFGFEMSMGDLVSATGAADPRAEAASVTVDLAAGGMTSEIEALIIGTEIWANVGELGGMLGVQTPWLHLDQAGLPGGGLLGMEPGSLDLAGAAELLAGLDEVERVDAHTFRGEIDLAEVESGMLRDRIAGPAGQTTDPLEFVATVDDQGRLTHLVVTLPPDAPADQLEARYFDFGRPVEVTPPPDDQVSELPGEFAELFPR